MSGCSDIFNSPWMDRFKRILRYTFIWGILTHGYVLFNKLSWHDDLSHGFKLSIDRAVSLGRWGRALLGHLVTRLVGANNLSLPVLNGMVSIVFIALSAWVISELMEIREKSWQVLLCGLLVTFPVVTGTFAYMFTAPYYMLALLLATVAAYAASRSSGWIGFLIGSACVCLSTGIYQSYFSVAVSLFVILLVFDIAHGRTAAAAHLIRRGLYYLCICIVGMALYFVCWKLSLKVRGIAADDYQGISSLGSVGITAYIGGVQRAYTSFFLYKLRGIENMYPFGQTKFQWAVIGLSVLCGVCMAVRTLKKDRVLGVLQAILIALLPLCFNLVYVMGAATPQTKIHSLMLYGQAMLYVFLIGAVRFISGEPGKLATVLRRVTLALLLVMVCVNTYFDNSCYFRAQFEQQETISSLTVLVSRIKGLEGYNDKMRVCFIVEGGKDASVTSLPGVKDIQLTPYSNIYPSGSKRRNLVNALRYWCGFQPKQASSKKFESLDEVQQMPVYPDDGSVRIINDTVVVKW